MFFGRSDHCHQWFYDGFLMLLPSLSMVFDGFGPLVKQCDGFDGSLWSIQSSIIVVRNSQGGDSQDQILSRQGMTVEMGVVKIWGVDNQGK